MVNQFTLISAYKPPSADNITFTSDLTRVLARVLDEAFLLCENVICIGDLNLEILHSLYNKQGKCLLDISDIYDLDSLVNKQQAVMYPERVIVLIQSAYPERVIAQILIWTHKTRANASTWTHSKNSFICKLSVSAKFTRF